MKRAHKNQSGFGVLEGLLVILVVVILVLGGWGVYGHYHKTDKNNTSTTTSSQTSSSTAKNSNSSGTNTDPYAGWKTYCDTATNYCFRYPSGWTLQSSAVQTTVLNPSKTVEVDYINPYAHDSGLLSFTPVSITTFTNGKLDAKIVGGVYTPANEPDYGIVDTGLLTNYPLTIGEATQFPNALRFTNPYSTNSSSVAFRARATNTMGSEAEAEAWFKTNDATTSLLILKSLYYK